MTKKKRLMMISCIAAVVLLAAVALGIFLFQNHKAKLKKEENARLFREFYDGKLATFEQENRGNATVDVVFLGDSLTDGCDLSVYYPEYSCFNRGIGGDTSYRLIDRLQVSAYDTNPKAIVLLIGGNDILGGKSLESVYENYKKIITGLQEHLPNAKIVWCSLTAMGNDWAKHNDTAMICNQKIKLLSQKYGCTFVDLFTPLCNPETNEIFADYTIEGVHLTDAGYRVVSAEIKAALETVLADQVK